MKTRRWKQIENLYHHALEIEREKRAAYLRAETNGDAVLLNELESLLAEHDKNDDFLLEPAFELGLGVLSESKSKFSN